MPSVDEKLLSQEQSAADRAGEIRASRRNNEKNNFNQNLEDEDINNRPAVFKQQKQIAKLKKDLLDKNKKVGVGSMISRLAIFLAQLFRQAWINLINSFGLTLSWINIHVFGNLVFGSKVFCNLGEEWFIRSGTAKNPAQQKLIKEGGTKIGVIEKSGCAGLNIVFFIVIIFFLAIGVILLEIFKDPIGFVVSVDKAVLGVVWDEARGIFSSDPDLINGN